MKFWIKLKLDPGNMCWVTTLHYSSYIKNRCQKSVRTILRMSTSFLNGFRVKINTHENIIEFELGLLRIIAYYATIQWELHARNIKNESTKWKKKKCEKMKVFRSIKNSRGIKYFFGPENLRTFSNRLKHAKFFNST